MESTLHDLGQLLLKAIPTIFLLVLVHFYLKSMFFRPMSNVLGQRRAATEGLRESADKMRAITAEKTHSIEAHLREARDSIYEEQEEARRNWTVDQVSQMEEARKDARERIHSSDELLSAEAVAAKSELASRADALADQIAQRLLERTPAA